MARGRRQGLGILVFLATAAAAENADHAAFAAGNFEPIAQGADSALPDTIGTPAPRAPKLEPPRQTPAVESPPRPAPSSTLAEEAKVVVSRFQFSGNTLLTSAELEAIVAGWVNRPISLDEIYTAADAATRAYHERGHTLAVVDVPAQSTTDAVVRLEVAEGRVASVDLSGNRTYKLKQLQDYLGQTGNGAIYQRQALETGLMRLNRLPGLNVKAVLNPGTDYGTSQLLLQASENPFAATLIGDNHGRKNLGEYRTSLIGTFNNPLRLEDQFQVLAVQSERGLLTYGYAQYSLPLWALGPRLSLSYGEAQFEQAGAFEDFEGRNRNGRVGLFWPLLLTRADEFSLGFAVSRTLTNADLAGNPISASQLTLYELSGSYTRNHLGRATSQVSATLSSSGDKGRAQDVPREEQGLRVELDMQHLQPLASRVDGYVRITGVYSPDPLPDITQFALGGPDNVRGYPASEVRGDRGVFGSLGLRSGFRWGSSLATGRIFADAGTASLEETVPGTADSESLSSAGVGLDWQLRVRGFSLSATADWSFPLSEYEAVDDDRSSRVFGSLVVCF